MLGDFGKTLLYGFSKKVVLINNAFYCFEIIYVLFGLGSDISSAATAFAAALLSQLLDFISQYLKQVFPVENNSKADSKERNDEFVKMKKRILMNKRKRCRRRSSQSSEHTESGDENLKNEDDLSDLSEGSFLIDVLRIMTSYYVLTKKRFI